MARETLHSKLLPALCLALAIPIGVGIATFRYAEGFSYLSSDPAACANCHIMWPQYESWQKSSHKAVAGCVDCHLPHDFVGKYIAKAENGWNHSQAFTLQSFHEPIQINAKNSEILQDGCLHCHAAFVHAQAGGRAAEIRCVQCHATVGHGERVGLGGPLRELPVNGDPR